MDKKRETRAGLLIENDARVTLTHCTAGKADPDILYAGQRPGLFKCSVCTDSIFGIQAKLCSRSASNHSWGLVNLGLTISCRQLGGAKDPAGLRGNGEIGGSGETGPGAVRSGAMALPDGDKPSVGRAADEGSAVNEPGTFGADGAVGGAGTAGGRLRATPLVDGGG